MARPQVPSVVPPQSPAVVTPVTKTDIHQGDNFVALATLAVICAVLATSSDMLFGVRFFAGLAEIVLVQLTLDGGWQRVKWSSVKVPLSGYVAFAKGRYLSGHTALRQPEDAVLGLTSDSLCLSTVGGSVESIHLLQIMNVTRHNETRSAWA